MSDYFRELKNDITVLKRETLNFSPHLHDAVEICYVISGNGEAYCNGKKYILKKGNVFLVFPNQVHHFENFNAGKYYTAIIPKYALEDYGELLKNKAPTYSCTETIKGFDISALLNVMYSETQSSNDPIILKNLATALFGKVIKEFTMVNNNSSDTVAVILDYCIKHYKEDICIADIAESVYLCKSTVSRIFSDKINLNFNDYINSLRVSEFLKIVRLKNSSVTSAAYASGVKNLRTFNRAFKKIYGVSPTEYINLKNQPQKQ